MLYIQDTLLSEATADQEITEEFCTKFSEEIGSRWTLLASLLSFTTAEIEEIKRGVTGEPSVKAAAMMSRWKEKSPKPTCSLLKHKVESTNALQARRVL